MTDIYNSVVALIGPVPAGAEPIVYIVCCIMALYMLTFVSGFIGSFFYTGKR